ncbi:MAG: hypothetical protein V1494_01735 [Candidatus Diapherotrites archaeon]
MKKVLGYWIALVLVLVVAFALLVSMYRSSAVPMSGLITMQDEQILNNAFSGTKLKADYVKTINDSLSTVPGFVISIFGNERINLMVKMDDGSGRKFGIISSNGKVAEAYSAYLTKPTMEATAKESTIQRIRKSNAPVSEFTKALNSGEIQYKGIGLGNQVKEAGVKAGSSIYGIADSFLGFFNGIFGRKK